MAEENKKSYSNIFIANTIYPEAKSIFSFQLQPIEEIKDDCYIVLDTNVLLAPYILGKEDLLEQCRKTYSHLVTANRLVIPGQVAREFAKNRQEKLTELHQQLMRKKQIQHIKQGKYPLLSSLDEFKEVVRLGEEVDKKLSEYHNAIDRVLALVQEWHWNDPVSVLYHKIFSDSTIVDIHLDENDIKKDLSNRQQHDIPPGYKDSGKKDEGVGDLLVWYTILEVGKTYHKSVIFVTGEEKADWYKKSEGKPLYPRYELVDEFRRKSSGQSFHIVKFSRFLELYGATEKVVEEIKKEERILISQTSKEQDVPNLWVKQLILTLTFLDSDLSVFLRLSGFNVDEFKAKMSRHYHDLLVFNEESYESGDADIPITLLELLGELENLINKEIYIDGGKTMNEFISIIHELQEINSFLLKTLRKIT